MAINATTNYLLAKKSESLLAFARQLTNVTVMLYGPGQLDVSGMPVACAGRLKRLVVFDGTTVGSVDSDVDIDTGDQSLPLTSLQAFFLKHGVDGVAGKVVFIERCPQFRKLFLPVAEGRLRENMNSGGGERGQGHCPEGGRKEIFSGNLSAVEAGYEQLPWAGPM